MKHTELSPLIERLKPSHSTKERALAGAALNAALQDIPFATSIMTFVLKGNPAEKIKDWTQEELFAEAAQKTFTAYDKYQNFSPDQRLAVAQDTLSQITASALPEQGEKFSALANAMYAHVLVDQIACLNQISRQQSVQINSDHITKIAEAVKQASKEAITAELIHQVMSNEVSAILDKKLRDIHQAIQEGNVKSAKTHQTTLMMLVNVLNPALPIDEAMQSDMEELQKKEDPSATIEHIQTVGHAFAGAAHLSGAIAHVLGNESAAYHLNKTLPDLVGVGAAIAMLVATSGSDGNAWGMLFNALASMIGGLANQTQPLEVVLQQVEQLKKMIKTLHTRIDQLGIRLGIIETKINRLLDIVDQGFIEIQHHLNSQDGFLQAFRNEVALGLEELQSARLQECMRNVAENTLTKRNSGDCSEVFRHWASTHAVSDSASGSTTDIASDAADREIARRLTQRESIANVGLLVRYAQKHANLGDLNDREAANLIRWSIGFGFFLLLMGKKKGLVEQKTLIAYLKSMLKIGYDAKVIAENIGSNKNLFKHLFSEYTKTLREITLTLETLTEVEMHQRFNALHEETLAQRESDISQTEAQLDKLAPPAEVVAREFSYVRAGWDFHQSYINKTIQQFQKAQKKYRNQLQPPITGSSVKKSQHDIFCEKYSAIEALPITFLVYPSTENDEHNQIIMTLYIKNFQGHLFLEKIRWDAMLKTYYEAACLGVGKLRIEYSSKNNFSIQVYFDVNPAFQKHFANQARVLVSNYVVSTYAPDKFITSTAPGAYGFDCGQQCDPRYEMKQAVAAHTNIYCQWEEGWEFKHPKGKNDLEKDTVNVNDKKKHLEQLKHARHAAIIHFRTAIIGIFLRDSETEGTALFEKVMHLEAIAKLIAHYASFAFSNNPDILRLSQLLMGKTHFLAALRERFINTPAQLQVSQGTNLFRARFQAEFQTVATLQQQLFDAIPPRNTTQLVIPKIEPLLLLGEIALTAELAQLNQKPTNTTPSYATSEEALLPSTTPLVTARLIIEDADADDHVEQSDRRRVTSSTFYAEASPVGTPKNTQTSSASHLDIPLYIAYLFYGARTLHEGFLRMGRMLKLPSILSTNSPSPETSSETVTHENDQLIPFSKSQTGNDRAIPMRLVVANDHMPMLEARDPSYTVYVLPKNIGESALSSRAREADIPQPLIEDTYRRSSCRPLGFFGKPSVFCEGEKTNVVYTPEMPQPPFANLDGHVMLGAVYIHLAARGITWVRNWWSGKSAKTLPSGVIASQKVFQEKMRACSDRLRYLTINLEEIQFNQLAPESMIKWLRWALEDHEETFKKLNRKGEATENKLEDFCLDLGVLHGEVKTIHTQHQEKIRENCTRFN